MNDQLFRVKIVILRLLLHISRLFQGLLCCMNKLGRKNTEKNDILLFFSFFYTHIFMISLKKKFLKVRTCIFQLLLYGINKLRLKNTEKSYVLLFFVFFILLFLRFPKKTFMIRVKTCKFQLLPHISRIFQELLCCINKLGRKNTKKK